MDGDPFIFLSLWFLNFFKLINSNVSIQRASGQNDTKLGSCPFNFPYWWTWDFYTVLLIPSLCSFFINFDWLITACCGNTFTSPIETKIMYDDTLWELSDNVNFIFLEIHLLLFVPDNNKEVKYLYCDNFSNKIFIHWFTEIIQ